MYWLSTGMMSSFLLATIIRTRSYSFHDFGRSSITKTNSCLLRSMSLSSQNDERYNKNKPRKIAVIGGGASGIFASIAAASSINNKNEFPVDVTVFEATGKTLQKVKISGGGRCNVMHDTTKSTSTILSGYPRGNKELRGIFMKRFTPTMAREWFEQRGKITLKTEEDGRMFPVTDSSQTVIDALLNVAKDEGVTIRTKQLVKNIVTIPESKQNEQREDLDNGNKDNKSSSSLFQIIFKDENQQHEYVDAVILATGSSAAGYTIAKSLLEGTERSSNREEQEANELGSSSKETSSSIFVSPVPSLFTLSSKENVLPGGLLHGLSGISVPNARVSLVLPPLPSVEAEATSSNIKDDNNNNEPSNGQKKKKKKRNKKKNQNQHLIQEGPVLITHHGVSGPAVLRLSAFAAREFHMYKYQNCHVAINWDTNSFGSTVEETFNILWKFREIYPRKTIASFCPIPDNTIPRRLWSTLCNASGIGSSSGSSSSNSKQKNEKLSPSAVVWANASKQQIKLLATQCASCRIDITGKGTFKEEFVTAGGISLQAMDMTKCMSKPLPGFFACGEVLNVDGITGGFNFLNCWSTGYIAGTNAAEYVVQPKESESEVSSS